MINETHNPDVLNCLANLSSDEVFTSPKIANEMLDMLPQELFENPNTTFLDPCTKSGVFLREIAKRLLVGLEKQIPNLQERINHIFTKQLYGIAITQLTSLLSRRSVYCSKTANGKYSIVDKFTNDCGNIKFSNCKHVWNDDFRCIYCGVNQTRETYNRQDMEVHAYEFIHTENPQELFNMKFDVIIGNPPYQLETGGGKGSSAIPLYHKFVQQAKKLQPRYLTMIIPSRWFSGGRGLDDFREEMLGDKRIRVIHDFFNASECFPGIDLSGGVCYFLWDRDNKGDCEITTYNSIVGKSTMKRDLLDPNTKMLIRFNNAIPIIEKVRSKKEIMFSNLVSTTNPYGLPMTIHPLENSTNETYKIYAYPKDGYIKKEMVLKNNKTIDKWKVFISKAYGERGDFPYFVIGKPFIGEPNSCGAVSYLLCYVTDRKIEAENVISYMKTKFFRFLVLQLKNTQNSTSTTYSLVPMQDFNESWTDEKLYKKYNLTKEEIDFIESMIKPMN